MTVRVVVPERITGHILRGHPWIYADALAKPLHAEDGSIVELVNKTRGNLGMALFSAHSPIALRVLTRGDEKSLNELWQQRIHQAWQLRKRMFALRNTDAFRLIHGEGDGLPGFVVDHYAGYLVIQLDTTAWLPHLSTLVQHLMQICQPKGVYFKGAAHRRRSNLSGENVNEVVSGTEARVLAGEKPPEMLLVHEGDIHFHVSIEHGQKTGLFLDQRENRLLVRQYSQGFRVLNLFSYTGGFSLAAALGGASQVTSVDSAEPVITNARDNFRLNNISPDQHQFAAQDAFQYLEQCIQANQEFDFVIVDPPSFAPRKTALAKAMNAYVRLNAKAISRIRSGGLLASSSCSSHVTMDMFLRCLSDAASKARRTLRILEIRRQPADHPCPLHFPEGQYLKFVLAIVD